MDFGFTPEQEKLRQEVRDFIAEHITPEVVAEMEGGEEAKIEGQTPGPQIPPGLCTQLDGRIFYLAVQHPIRR